MIKILLVEDNEFDIDIMKRTLERSKIKVQMDVVEDGRQAIKYLLKEDEFVNKKEPNIVFLDLNLPIKNGHEVLKEIRSTSTIRHIPVVILTSSKRDEDIRAAYKEHANCYLQKPVDLEGFRKMVKAIDLFWFTVVEFPN